MEPSGSEDSGFLGKVAIDGDTIVVGVVGDDELGPTAGAAYVFTRFRNGWRETQKLTASDGDEFDTFGVSVAVYDHTIGVGAWFD